MNCLIIDDDPLMVHILETMINEFDFLNFIGSTSNALDAIKILDNNNVDIVFLDIEMPNVTGIEFLNIYPFKDINVIVISSHKKYAVETYNFEVTDYLLKPIEKERFLKAVLKVRNKQHQQQTKSPNDSIFIKVNNSFESIVLKDINYIESEGDYVTFYTDKNKFLVLSTMKKIEKSLPEDQFFRIHNSYIVRIDKISKYEESTVYINSNFFPVSRSNKTKLLALLNFI